MALGWTPKPSWLQHAQKKTPCGLQIWNISSFRHQKHAVCSYDTILQARKLDARSQARWPPHTLSGISTGTLSGWPFVGGVTWCVLMVYVFLAASYEVETVRVGVPAWLYQRPTPDRSSPLASAMAARKSSHVTAWGEAKVWQSGNKGEARQSSAAPTAAVYRHLQVQHQYVRLVLLWQNAWVHVYAHGGSSSCANTMQDAA